MSASGTDLLFIMSWDRAAVALLRHAALRDEMRHLIAAGNKSRYSS